MLKCASCQAYLYASLQLAFDFNKYRFSILLVDEPFALLSDFQERFQSLCQLELQLPSLKTEDLKSMLIEEEADYKTEDEKTPVKRASDLQIHVTACVLALCGWTSSPSSGSIHLPLITCCRCMRKAGLWGFHQIESAPPEREPSPGLTNTPSATPDGRSDKVPTVPTSPHRMMTRSRDMTIPLGSEQQEKSPSPVISRMRSWDGSNLGERTDTEAASPTTRSRPVTRSMGQGDVSGLGADDSCTRSFFDPVSQHRDWCPWVNVVRERPALEATGDHIEEGKDGLGWQVVLKALLATKQLEKAAYMDFENLSAKSRKVFRIFRQWEATCSS
ncbi:hypothetical protein JD844_029029 [Phrynosoma platyrhinos]|uniref:NuBaID C-terminal domain-containing protein n=1 Tax=Phrynosoma platyrhinos TaxID=52577 RepID=A0ABQ7SIR4_PHRPL|nr:hypothetical protein JD844_029029 [Phrynosoma platyrhinos]